MFSRRKGRVSGRKGSVGGRKGREVKNLLEQLRLQLRLRLTDGGSRTVTAQLLFSERKTLTLRVLSPEEIEIRVPIGCSQAYVLDFLQSKSDWLSKKIDQMENALPALSREEQKELMIITVGRSAAFLRAYAGKQPSRIVVRHQKTQWGSCSAEGVIALNLNCGLLTDALFEYVMIHELAHLYELNHSAAFWALVEERLPDYKKRRVALKAIPLR